MKKTVLKIFKFLLLVLFLSYYCESTLFFHTHTFYWGTVTHSHPYLPHGGHTHSAEQCQTISFLTNILFTIIDTLALVVTLRVIILQYVARLDYVARHIVGNCSLRGPPVSIC